MTLLLGTVVRSVHLNESESKDDDNRSLGRLSPLGDDGHQVARPFREHPLSDQLAPLAGTVVRILPDTPDVISRSQDLRTFRSRTMAESNKTGDVLNGSTLGVFLVTLTNFIPIRIPGGRLHQRHPR